MGTQPSGSALAVNVATAVASFAVAGAVFHRGWQASARRVWRFNSFAEVHKADWSSRINSTVHAIVVCTLVAICLLTMSFDPETLVPIGSTTLMEVTFSISIGYFFFDLAAIIWWMLPMWSVFIVHHLVALTPYVITQFFYTCHAGQYALLVFLLVEASTVPLNAMAFLEDLGRRRSTAHRVAHGTMYSLWFVFRVLLPAYLMVLIWTKIVRQFDSEETCLLPSMICAHIIALFCIGIFIFVLTPEVWCRLRHGDKEEPEIDVALSEGAVVQSSSPVAMEMGEGGGNRSPGAAGGAYHDLESVGSAEGGPPSPKRTIASVAREGPQQMAKAFREGLLPHGDDDGGPGHSGADRSSSGQMR